ncbi:sensor domain-containing diguanylate cyclase [Paenibacillus qinlingensis]|uniref:sensor domain-containing diguanylate cyclase n=1 Tax=Paenibacillus qinlingensis TaxID=1837343 RepID=UPI0015668FB4|nr:sensor domain-containing diguanylate cyclase [Paenibacillus qinlingensis]NQX60643.1 GGDEF domain-containing protein [Paenibacillus qinlingensis]
MINFLLPLCLFLLPVAYLSVISFLIYSRNPKKIENKFAAFILITIAGIFFTEYAKTQLSLAYTIPIAKYIEYPLTFLSAGVSFLFYLRITHYHKKMSTAMQYSIAGLTFTLYMLTLLLGRGYRLFHGVDMHGMWKDEIAAPSFYFFVLLLFLLSFSVLGIAIQALRQSQNNLQRKKYSLLLQCSVVYLSTYLFLTILVPVTQPYLYISTSVYIFPTLSFSIYIHILMRKYDFLPSLRRKYEILFEMSPVMIVLLDENAVITEANPAAYDLLNWPAHSTLIGEPYIQFIPTANQDKFLSNYRNNFGYERIKDFEYTIISKALTSKTVIVDTDILHIEGNKQILAIVRDVSQRKKEEQYMSHLARHDMLTGLPNRLSFETKLGQLTDGDTLFEGTFGLMLIDLDKFKPVNDEFGHHVGDQLLHQVGQRLTCIMEHQDMVARLGGDEFVAIIRGNKERITSVSKAILQQITTEFLLDGITAQIGASIGISMYPAQGDQATALVRQADSAMYVAKKAGGNRFIFFTES